MEDDEKSEIALAAFQRGREFELQRVLDLLDLSPEERELYFRLLGPSE